MHDEDQGLGKSVGMDLQTLPQELGEAQLEKVREAITHLSGFVMNYQFGIEEVMTKIKILQTEFELLHEYSPIEHVSSRLKKPESILAKLQKAGLPLTLESVKENVRDIAGVRVVCSFVSDAYRIAQALERQKDLVVVEAKDYIKEPKGNGYRSLHLNIEVPVFLSNATLRVPVEVQIRTIAMDFWASLEHKIYYKFDAEIPMRLNEGLLDAALTAARLDEQMEQIHKEIKGLRPEASPQENREEAQESSIEAVRRLFAMEDN